MTNSNSGSGCLGTIATLIAIGFLITVAPYLLGLAVIILLIWLGRKIYLHKKENEKIAKLEGYIQSNIDANPHIDLTWVRYEDSNLKGSIPKSVYLEEVLSKMEEAIFEIQRLKDEKQQLEEKSLRELELLDEEERRLEVERKKVEETLDALSSQNGKFTPQEILTISQSPSFFDYTGIYIITNEDTNKVYVGQAKNVVTRILQHFQGKGCPDVYADYKYNANQSIQTLSLAKSGYENLDRLEKDYISRYDSCINGYNKTQGNGK